MAKAKPAKAAVAHRTSWRTRRSALSRRLESSPADEWSWLWRLRVRVYDYMLRRYAPGSRGNGADAREGDDAPAVAAAARVETAEPFATESAARRLISAEEQRRRAEIAARFGAVLTHIERAAAPGRDASVESGSRVVRKIERAALARARARSRAGDLAPPTDAQPIALGMYFAALLLVASGVILALMVLAGLLLDGEPGSGLAAIVAAAAVFAAFLVPAAILIRGAAKLERMPPPRRGR
jgi:hypothetical protein